MGTMNDSLPCTSPRAAPSSDLRHNTRCFFLFFGTNSHVFCLFVRARSTLLKYLAPCSSFLSSRDIYRTRIFLEYTLLFFSPPTDTFFNLQQSQRLRLDLASLHQELPFVTFTFRINTPPSQIRSQIGSNSPIYTTFQFQTTPSIQDGMDE